jgi:hypothetical protein
MIQEIIKYQEIDGKLRKLEREYSQLPERKKAAEMQNVLKEGQNRLAALEQNAQKANENFERAKAYYGDLAAKIETLSKSIDSVDLERARELQKAKNSLYSMIEKLEKELVKISNQLTMVNNEYNAIIKNAKAAKTNLDVYKAKFAENKNNLEPKIEALKAELADQAKKVDKKVLDKYNAKRESKFPVLVKNVNGTCGGCRMTISASRMREFIGKGMVECENCGRIIYSEK